MFKSNKKIIKCPQPSYSCKAGDYNFKGISKKDNSKKGDIFENCRSCGDYIKGDYRSNFDGRYCQDCL